MRKVSYWRRPVFRRRAASFQRSRGLKKRHNAAPEHARAVFVFSPRLIRRAACAGLSSGAPCSSARAARRQMRRPSGDKSRAASGAPGSAESDPGCRQTAATPGHHTAARAALRVVGGVVRPGRHARLYGVYPMEARRPPDSRPERTRPVVNHAASGDFHCRRRRRLEPAAPDGAAASLGQPPPPRGAQVTDRSATGQP